MNGALMLAAECRLLIDAEGDPCCCGDPADCDYCAPVRCGGLGTNTEYEPLTGVVLVEIAEAR